jgi:hypothetical protein
MNKCETIADDLSIKFGVFIDVRSEAGLKFRNNAVGDDGGRIYFKIGEHEFESINDVITALNNKAFL